MVELLERLNQVPDSKGIQISYAPENHTAERLYAQLGFRATDDIGEREIVAQLQME